MKHIEQSDLPLMDNALDFFLRVGACTAAKFTRSCMYGDKFSDTSKEEFYIYQEMNDNIPGFIRGFISKELLNFPQTVDEMYEMVLRVLVEYAVVDEDELYQTIAMVEGLIGRTILEACHEVIEWEEETLFISSDPDLRPVMDAMNMMLKEVHVLITGTAVELCSQNSECVEFVRNWAANVAWNIPNLLNVNNLII